MSGRIFTPFAIGPFTILPEDALPPEPCGIPLVLGRKGAFGSGEHETTASCLEMLARRPEVRGARGLDLGSGTGILAIAAIRLGAEAVVAVDIEWPAAVSCAANARLNGMEDRVLTVCGELNSLRGEQFDLLLANIYADLHLALADQMVAMTRRGGLLLLSGIPLQDKFDIQNRFARLGCRQLDMGILEDYVTILMGKG
ncbi:50S ribosomal protein L11 methyltransferase [Geomobilimonas luticola]|uniref:50S ribosomal protein L11 methyltransferase n=1 Tax=Geomobilimonas luticola TaxID=1114878 RepID=A0ABS5S8P0_9BACT|nr:50S ribosomal protein L11 methyltransferase [Geomobilimonas luticola]MBT0651743.1 50S ribosomal protein L11 methyltransferase [Geomobilimonas luticola]